MSPYSDNAAAPDRPAPAVDKSAQEARQGETPGRMRYVLGISTGLAIIALIIVYFIVLT